MRSNPFRAVLAAAILWGSLQTQVFGQQPVAKVVEIEGPKMVYERSAKTGLAFPLMPTLIKDEYATDANTVAALEFVTGGRVAINKKTKIEVVSESAIQEDGKPLVKRIKVKSGRVWAKITKRKDPLEVETAGGVMGIKGTEFVIGVAENGDTSLELVEGTIEITPASGGAPFTLEGPAAVDLLAAGTALPVVKKYDSEDELRTKILDSPEWSQAQQALNILNSISGYSFGSFGAGTLGGAMSEAATVASWVSNPAQIVEDMKQRALSEVNSRIPGPFGVSIPSGGGSSKPVEPDFPTTPSPAENMIVASPPTFSWTGTKVAKKGYLLLVAQDEKMEKLEWAAKVKEGTSVTYPAEATPLPPGVYYWRVMGLDEEGKPTGRATQSVFQSQGWAAVETPEPPAPPVPPTP